MVNFRKKVFLALLVISLSFYTLYQVFWLIQLNDGIVQEVILVEMDTTPTRNVKLVAPIKEIKLVTILTTFVYDERLENTEYRYFVQSNFLRMTTFESFRKNANIIIFTNSLKFKLLITEEYPEVIVLHCKTRNNFTTPMLKDLFSIAEKLVSSFFYMYANGDNLYDSNLIQTLFHVKKSWETGLIRQKILIVGLRKNKVVQELVEDEQIFQDNFINARPFRTDAQDYFIVTKDSIEWMLYPEVLVGRIAYDNMLVDLGVHNEIETIDASVTIRLVHQSEKDNNHSSFHQRNNVENDWNWKLAKFQVNHMCITCARYKTEFVSETNEVRLIDKKTDLEVVLSERKPDYFEKEHQYWVGFSGSEGQTKSTLSLIPSLVVAVLAYNKPDSLMRLLTSLGNIGNSEVRIDLIISLDIGYLGYYDLPTLMVAKKFEWLHGKKKVVLKDKHRGQLYQWLEVCNSVNSKQEVMFLILEDCMVMSPQWYDYVSGVISQSQKVVEANVSGWSLETPVVWQSPSDIVKMFYEEYAAKSSLVLGEIKRVRSFIPQVKIWKGFVEWFMKESQNTSNDVLSDTIAAQLEIRGTYTPWESEMWVTWFSYYLKLNHPTQQEIGYITKRSGSLANKMHMSPIDKAGEGVCFSDELISSEIQNLVVSIENDSILIPEVLPKYKIQPVI